MDRLVPAAAALALGLAGCGVPDPESELAQLVAAAASAAEARDTGHFRDLIAESYTDSRGNDRAQLIDAIRGYFITNPAIEVVTRVEAVELLGQDAARIVVFAGLLGRHSGVGALPTLDGRLYRLELELIEAGGDWQVIGARWERSFDARIGGD